MKINVPLYAMRHFSYQWSCSYPSLKASLYVYGRTITLIIDRVR